MTDTRNRKPRLNNEAKRVLFVVGGVALLVLLVTGIISLAIGTPVPFLSTLVYIATVATGLGILVGLHRLAARIFPDGANRG